MMKTKIKFVRKYEMYGHEYLDVIYKTNRAYMYAIEPNHHLPLTIANFMVNASKVTTQYDKVFNRQETIYEF